MALTQTQVSQLYISLFGRASEGEGNKFWQNGYNNQLDLAKAMLESAGAKAYFGEAFNDDKKFIEHIYKNTLNRDITKDLEGMKFWTDLIKVHGRPFIVNEMIKAITTNPANAGSVDQKIFNNKVAISNYAADKIHKLDSANAASFLEILGKITDDAASLTAAQAFVDTIPSGAVDTSSDWVSTPEKPGEVFTLTVNTDEKTANVFNAPLAYNPGGTDRLMTLEDDDKLTGTAGRKDNTLNLTMAQATEEGTGLARSPHLVNIQYLNAEMLGDVSTLDLRYANDLTKVNISKITERAGNNVKVINIGSKLEGVRVANAANQEANANFTFKEGVLAGNNDKALLELNNVLAKSVNLTSNAATPEGYETISLTAKNGVDIDSLTVNQMTEIAIKGSGNLKIADYDINNDSKATYPLEFFKLGNDSGINTPGSLGLNKIDASGFNGKLTLDISNNVNPKTNPFSSGKDNPVEIIGSGNDDVFLTKNAPGEKATIKGGAGKDKLVVISGGINNKGEQITEIETLELRNQKDKNALVADLDAFKDELLEKVVVRDETQKENSTTVISKFELKNVTDKFAKDGKIIIEHSATTKVDDGYEKDKIKGTIKDVNLKINLKDGSKDNDSVTVEVVDANNVEKIFNYEIEAIGKETKTLGIFEKVEKITVKDNDSESNVVKFVSKHDEITLEGGTEKLTYTVDHDLDAKLIDASKQKSDLRLKVVDPAKSSQTIKLGTGNDILTFSLVDGLDKGDVITDAGGEDVVRAAFSKDSVLNLKGIEELHVVANKNVELDIAKAEVKKVVIMSDKAVDGGADFSKLTPEPFSITGVDNTKIITFKNSNLTELNFFADLDIDDELDNGNDSTVQEFNGVKLENNKSADLKVNINSSLDDYEDGATAYNVGKLTIHGVENLSIVVSDEKPGTKDTGPAAAKTTIDNIWGEKIKNITVEAKGSVNLQTISGNGTFNNTDTLNAEKVKGDFDAHIISLNHGAEVKLGNGNNTFSALGSSGRNVTITSGKGDDIITGTAQGDTIEAGNGKNTVYADRGDNIVKVGDGDDKVYAKDGSNNIELGKGTDSYEGNWSTTSKNLNMVTTISKKEGVAHVKFDTEGASGADLDKAVDQHLVVAKGDDVKAVWEGVDLKLYAVNGGQAATAGTDANDHILVGAQYLGDTTGLDYTKGKEGVANATGTIDAKDGDDIVVVTYKQTGNLVVNGGKGNDTIIVANKSGTVTVNGGEGNDTIYLDGNIAYTEVYGGVGADKIYINNDTKNDVIKFNKEDSLLDSYDIVYNFKLREGGKNVEDTLDFGGATIKATAANVDGDNSGSIKSHNIDGSGIITFDDVDGYAAALVVSESNLADVIAYLAANIKANDNKAVAFAYDKDGNIATTDDQSMFVFVDNDVDSLVKLDGLSGVTAIDTTADAGTILIA